MEDDFSVCCDDFRGKWSVVHAPTGAEILSLDTDLYEKVEVVNAKALMVNVQPDAAQLYVLAVRRDAESLMLPIRFGGRQAGSGPNRMASVEILGTQEVVALWFNAEDTIGDVKNRLAGLCGIAPIEQALWIGNARVDNDRMPVRESGLDARNAYIRVGRSGKLRVGVRSTTGAAARLMVLPSSTVGELKEMIAQRLNIPARRQVVLLDGRELPHEASVRECGVFNGIELTVVPRSKLAASVPRFAPPATPGRGGAAFVDGEPMDNEELNHAVEDVLSSVGTLVQQQTQLQRTLHHLVSACNESVPRQLDGSLVPARTPYAAATPGAIASPAPSSAGPAACAHGPPYPGAAAHDALAQSRRLRMQAAAEAEAALRLTSYPPYPSSGGEAATTGWNRHNILSHIAKEVRDFSEEDHHSVTSSLSRMERLRAEYDTIRHEMNLDNLRRALDPMCKLCGGAGGPGPDKPTPAGAATTAAKPAATTAAKTTTTTTTATRPASTTTAVKTTSAAPSATPRSATPPASSAARRDSLPVTSSAAKTPVGGASTVRRSSAPSSPGSKPLNPSSKPPVAMNLDDRPLKPPAASAPPLPEKKKKDTDGDDSDESVMGDDIMGDPEKVEQWMRERGRC